MNNARQIRPIAAAIVSSFETTSTPMPTAIAQIHERYVKVEAAMSAQTMPSKSVAEAVLAAIEAGNDPTTDPTVQQALTGAELASRMGLTDEVPGIVLEELAARCRTHGDELVDAWRVSFSAAASAITDALAVLGPIDLDDTRAVVRKGADATTSWTAATEATRTIAAINSGWGAFHALVKNGRFPDKKHALLRIAAVPGDVWLERDLAERLPDPWAAVLEGLELSLPTLDEYADRITALDQAAADAYAQAQEATRERRPSLVPLRSARVEVA
jgi:hypothetical protein